MSYEQRDYLIREIRSIALAQGNDDYEDGMICDGYLERLSPVALARVYLRLGNPGVCFG